MNRGWMGNLSSRSRASEMLMDAEDFICRAVRAENEGGDIAEMNALLDDNQTILDTFGDLKQLNEHRRYELLRDKDVSDETYSRWYNLYLEDATAREERRKEQKRLDDEAWAKFDATI